MVESVCRRGVIAVGRGGYGEDDVDDEVELGVPGGRKPERSRC